ncbi:hypothetical protein [Nonomuraea basaltis]|uniref:hypothetical protein n=1 Tax=Nonomuraea basaltis TaxID=2495887 RepID=UPI00110C5261|nr:hypothetical protein [Nonomuraea basaltis]TMS00110.1 hypothetical protein EJK15_03300 [Nonomuraea basaltis]
MERVDNFKRLAELMNQRRVALRLQWNDVAEQAGISTAHLRKFRSGEAGVSDLVRARLEEALQWASGSIESVLAGGDPTEMTSVTAPGGAGVIRVTAGAGEVQAADGLEAALRELSRRLSPERVRAILEEVAPASQRSDTPAVERRYEDPQEQHLWETPGLDEVERRYLIHQLESLRRLEEAKARQLDERPSADVREFRSRG